MNWLYGALIVIGLSAVLYRTFHLFIKEGKTLQANRIVNATLLKIEVFNNSYGPLRRGIFLIDGNEEPVTLPTTFTIHNDFPIEGVLTRQNGAFVSFKRSH